MHHTQQNTVVACLLLPLTWPLHHSSLTALLLPSQPHGQIPSWLPTLSLSPDLELPPLPHLQLLPQWATFASSPLLLTFSQLPSAVRARVTQWSRGNHLPWLLLQPGYTLKVTPTLPEVATQLLNYPWSYHCNVKYLKPVICFPPFPNQGLWGFPPILLGHPSPCTRLQRGHSELLPIFLLGWRSF